LRITIREIFFYPAAEGDPVYPVLDEVTHFSLNMTNKFSFLFFEFGYKMRKEITNFTNSQIMKNSSSFDSSQMTLPEALIFEVKHLPVKRIFDIVFSITVLTLGSPFFLLIALLVCLTSKGHAVYSHERIGRAGKPFRCYKFRSMYHDAETRLQELLEKDIQLKEEWNKTFKLKKDPRVTPIGLFLRKTSLDELPQFWNVLKGDLSVVGPRPVVQSEVTEKLGIKAAKILSVRPGLTGLWQVSGRSDTSYSTRIQLDEKYVDHVNEFSHPLMLDLIALDIKLIAKTIPTMISSKGAY
jgi:exopolysaccharide production protein ExoY